MPEKQQAFETQLSKLSTETVKSLVGIRHGIERETLRVTDTGALAQTAHPSALGSALKHQWITTDFSESLMEFITPPETDITKTINQLVDIHKFVMANLDDELLWPLSMPCFIDANTTIPIANYGTSNIAQLKQVYRKGLHNRYGSMMQVIAGVHLNFSLPDLFWQHWFEQEKRENSIHARSDAYLGLIRNFRKFSWLVPYLFGASPALCGSFIAHSQHRHPFQRMGKGTLYLPHATSLRMSDLGYTSTAQSNLHISYNDLDAYVASVREAINLPTQMYASISAGENGVWEQLNTNILQIENELYAPIRPKQVANYLEKPTDALADRGISYIEVRGLDVNPFSQVGIDDQQIRFMDAFLLYCLLLPSPTHSRTDHAIFKSNMEKVVINGRDPDLMLNSDKGNISINSYCNDLFDGIEQCANLLDDAGTTKKFSEAVSFEREKVESPDLTFSGRMLDALLDNDVDNSFFGLELAKEYKQFIDSTQYRFIDDASFKKETVESFEKQRELEKTDNVSFETFVKHYFSRD
ncbi:MAG: glutamate--cysteine ligase [Pseudomonadota bacterium]